MCFFEMLFDVFFLLLDSSLWKKPPGQVPEACYLKLFHGAEATNSWMNLTLDISST
jgi:hypothetical protein